MQIIPLIYLKGGKAVYPADSRPAWFQENLSQLCSYFVSQGASTLYVNDLNVPLVGKSENFLMLEAAAKQSGLELWVTGNFRSLAAIELYFEIGMKKVVLGGIAYQDPNLLKQATQRFPQKIAVLIEVKNKHVVIPGLVAPTKKTALDYAERFEEQGVSVLCYSDSDLNDTQNFCVKTKVPVVALCDIQNMQDLTKLFECESAGLAGVVIGKPFYENRLDVRSCVSFLNDLAAMSNQEITLKPE
ncbi:MAG: hypothetical protein A2W61_05055 [Deltaproteobacteria bacterium RIFCSPLOWO2_01_44_7]|nr:MAG: hypothetical protein A2712_09235 [Deltaproteobacteria bacterium RIFCSPHIGHO2_01_FULL_43_49]OGQ14466.1 MAG: hypothetical protein A3D22_09660 [Deltaproteobacteria bacterium RIFCSPHIGHO2_02_FULL_44_53]OGQ27847.1 MAG: hypothetical protein A3D98_04060 [Deltaproteobacteria bacterium RIFCSPHIGHO2_12_FULL_44_21]OGQ30923.1 MAG: hypothetical protein A2979_01735 [Deltaproteobacteria bacterium RIFCSPLOWO2_01_FULL_45_74]OGQ41150.1 MAG: hypothetical protein A2W61_05055 [Deltaproteobacteria bacterium 